MPRDPIFWPFDGRKTLYHVPYWAQMKRGVIPPPVLVTLDPINRCNLNCDWCNSSATIEKGGPMFSDEVIESLPRVLSDWGVRAVCIAGGGEPLLHARIGDLIEGLVDAGVEVGVVTNGTRIGDANIEALGRCRFVGISVDAGDAKVYRKLKGVDRFERVYLNMVRLRAAHPELEITWKVLLHPVNIHSMTRAAELADHIGCTFFHARPVGKAWNELGREEFFTEDEVRLAVGIINMLSEHEWPNGLRVINTPQKFSPGKWAIHHPFNRCYAVGMTCGIQANGTVTLCCDRRGDKRVELCTWKEPGEVVKAWNSQRHHEILDSIDLRDCPRCTYTPHNSLFEDFERDLGDPSCRMFI